MIAGLATPRTGRVRNREVTRERLLDAAVEAFCEHGFENTSLREIAQTVGVNHALIKYYFIDKETLWREATTQIMLRQRQFLAEELMRNLPASEREHMRLVLSAFVRFWASRRHHARMIYWSCMQDNDRMRWLAETFLVSHHEHALINIDRWQKAGLLPAGDPLFQSYSVLGVTFAPLVMASEIAHSHGRDVFDEASVALLVKTVVELLCRD